MTAPIGWLADRFGRKKLFVVCAAGFTFASLLCGLAQNIEQMVLFRLLQGMFGAALVPLSQAVMLDIYPQEQRGQAMAIWGVGVMLGPIMGPTLGGWLTETYSWHWVFLVNLPIGVVTVIGLTIFMHETPRVARNFDWFGFLALSVGIGALQLMLDRGEQVGWFDSMEIVLESIIAATGFYFFFAHSLTTPDPFVRFALFKDRNFVGGCLMMVVMGIVLFSTLALVTPFIQNVLGYPIFDAGLVLAARGLGTLFGMMMVGRLLRHIEARTLIFVGLCLTAISLYDMTGFTDQTSGWTLTVTGLTQGVGLGLVFIPLSTVAFLTLPANLRTDGTAILTLVRNIASSIGISVMIAYLTSTTTLMHARLVEHVTPFNDALQMPDVRAILSTATERGLALLDVVVTQQASIIAYDNSFKVLMWVALVAMPFVLVIGTSRVIRGRAPTRVTALD
jgi:DHA2 family multidrug resistance protein